ncbi:uncharacterized protein LOC134753805 [Cydia strobilella]|uniref:uncharacterized protein LOC134753805 n=1 Tax=Cydia strobilella TaxID=1100964 RepID=UPI003005236E
MSVLTLEGKGVWGGRARGGGAARPGWRRRELDQPRRPMEMLTSLYALLSGGQGVNPKIDSIAFRLHCGATTAALLAASAALTTRHLVGNPIDCIHTRLVLSAPSMHLASDNPSNKRGSHYTSPL